MTRRVFNAALAGAAFYERRGAVLRAMHGARLPATLRLQQPLDASHRYFERRTYTGDTTREDLLDVFARSGIAALNGEGRTFLIPFASLDERTRAWARVNSDSEWQRIRERVNLNEVTIYRRV